MNEIQLNELISRAQKLIGGIMPIQKLVNGEITSTDCEFIDTDNAIGESEEGQMRYSAYGKLKTSNGEIIFRPLNEIVRYLESKQHRV